MPMIDVYAAVRTFPDKHALAIELALALMTIEQVPDIPMFWTNAAALLHELPNDSPWLLLSDAPDGGWGIAGTTGSLTARRTQSTIPRG